MSIRKRSVAHPALVWAVSFMMGLLLILLSGSPARAGESNVDFTGQLVEDPCTVAAGPDGDAVEVAFGTIPDNMLYLHKRTWTETFHITLQDCDLTLGTKVHLTFTGSEDSEQPGLLAVTGAATHVAVGLLTADGRAIPLNKQTNDFILSKGNTTLQFGAYVQASVTGIKAHTIGRGDFTAITTFEIEYL